MYFFLLFHRTQARTAAESNSEVTFGHLLRCAISQGDYRNCPVSNSSTVPLIPSNTYSQVLELWQNYTSTKAGEKRRIHSAYMDLYIESCQIVYDRGGLPRNYRESTPRMAAKLPALNHMGVNVHLSERSWQCAEMWHPCGGTFIC